MHLPSKDYWKKIFIFYLASLILSGIVTLGICQIHKDTIVFFADANEPGFMQIFFPTNSTYSTYSEDASERTAYDGNPNHGIGLALPATAIKTLRVDVSDDTSTLLIKSAQLNYLFSTETLSPSDLAQRITPTHNIEKIELLPSGLLIETNGEDPQLNLSIYKQSNTRSIMKLIAIGFIMSLPLCAALLFFAQSNTRKLLSIFSLLTIPTVASLFITGFFYPGFMTYDSFHAIYSARNDVTDSTWPPMVSYVWRLVDLVSLNPSVMHFAQILLLISSLFYVTTNLTKRVTLSIGFILLYLSVPVILGTIAAIWKDVLMTSFFAASFATILAMKSTKKRSTFITLFLLSAVLIFLGTASRHNAITAAIPLAFYLAWVVVSRVSKHQTQLLIGTIALGIALTGTIYISKIQMDKYSLPSFKELKGATALIRVTRAMDIAGASICSETNLFSDILPELTLSEINEGYDARHSILSAKLLDKIPLDNKIDELWVSTAKSQPTCFFYNKTELAKYLVGANDGEQFLITSPQIDFNNYGYNLSKSSVRDVMVNYIINTSNLIYVKPWFLYLISISLLIIIVLAGALTAEAAVVFLSAAFYFVGLVMFGNAADARLLFYTTTFSLLGALMAATEIVKLWVRTRVTNYKLDLDTHK